ncbi:Cation Channel Sperm Associated 2 CatSper2 [Carpediemonas membranifera]|uniref:Cation Channel Sperm Associated 2 CatSper2 n=1 Tax=Carpediemonas membranifera TaxID=201153 RepID=A0A8J6B9H3_9EUKA|nr:Cation Channel Sperm Associated 2 CatSper2 [Carpediemonas membranifera]|eukprot:KAG9392757.1 Cation Channel Sperm Associated 2 CatSper2 [Carpediemonas membranifera]
MSLRVPSFSKSTGNSLRGSMRGSMRGSARGSAVAQSGISMASTRAGDGTGKNKEVTVIKDLSTRSAFFRQQLVEEFRISDQFEWNSKDAPVYSTRDLMLDPEQYHTILRDAPTQLVKFKHFKRQKHTEEFDKRLTRVRNIYHMPVGVWAAWLTNTRVFRWWYMFLVIVSSLLVVLQSELDSSVYYLVQDGIRILDYLIVALFFFEIGLKWCDSFSAYWKDGWNVFDFLVTVIALPDILLYFSTLQFADSSYVMQVIGVIRLVRTIRPLRMVGRFSFLRIIMQTIIRATVNLLFIVVLLFILMYIMAIFGINLFSDYTNSNRSDLIYQYQFESLYEAVVTMFQIMTFDHWLALYMDIKKVVPTYVVIPYFMLWIWVGALIFRNIFVGIMVNHFQNIKRELQVQADIVKKARRIQKLQRQLKRRKMAKDKERHEGQQDGPANDQAIAPERADGASSATGHESDTAVSSLGNRAMSNLSDETLSVANSGHSRRISDLSSAVGSDASKARVEVIQSDPTAEVTGAELRQQLDNLGARRPDTTWPRDTLFRYLRAMDNLMENQREFQELELLCAMALHQLHDTATFARGGI